MLFVTFWPYIHAAYLPLETQNRLGYSNTWAGTVYFLFVVYFVRFFLHERCISIYRNKLKSTLKSSFWRHCSESHWSYVFLVFYWILRSFNWIHQSVKRTEMRGAFDHKLSINLMRVSFSAIWRLPKQNMQVCWINHLHCKDDGRFFFVLT